MNDPWIRPLTLEGHIVRLTPLLREHASALWSVAQDPDLWRWMPWRIETDADFEKLVVRALKMTERNNESSSRPKNEDDAMAVAVDESSNEPVAGANDSKTKNAMVGKTIRIADTVSTSFVCSDRR